MPRRASHGRSPLPFRSRVAVLLILAVALALAGFVGPAQAQEADLGFSPSSGHARVIAQGVAPLPEGDAVWRTVRTPAPLPEDAAFEERPLGFVLATAGPLLLVDADTGQQLHLGIGEAAMVQAGTVQQRSSLAAQPVSYLSIELVGVDAAPPPAGAIVLQPGQPFPSPAGLRDLDLLSDTLSGGESFTVPNSGAKNVILITDGAGSVGRPDGAPVVLIAGEAASFTGELPVAPAGAETGSGGDVSFVVAIIGPEIPPPNLPTDVSATPAPPAGETPEATSGTGSIAVQVYTCPPGMSAETLNAAACAPAFDEFDVTLSGAALPAPLTIGDAEADGDTYSWSALPFGEYVIAEAVLPRDASTYVLAARDAAGSPEAGYRVTLDASEPELLVRIYNFAP